MSLILFTGHGGGQPGATGNETTEHIVVSNLLHDVVNVLRQPSYVNLDWLQAVDTPNVHEWDDMASMLNNSRHDLGVTFHLNAAGGRGAEVYVAAGGNYAAATKYCNAIAEALGIPNRGVKNGQDYRVGSIARSFGDDMLLVEICFIDNTEDMQAFNTNRDKLVQALAKTTVELVGGTWGGQGIPQPAPEVPQIPLNSVYSSVDMQKRIYCNVDWPGGIVACYDATLTNPVQGEKSPLNLYKDEYIEMDKEYYVNSGGVYKIVARSKTSGYFFEIGKFHLKADGSLEGYDYLIR